MRKNERVGVFQQNSVICLTGSKSKIRYQPLPQDAQVRRKPVIGLAEWKPSVLLEEGVEKPIGYFSAEIRKNRWRKQKMSFELMAFMMCAD